MTDDSPAAEKLQHYLSAWNLAQPQPLATTHTSYVYSVMDGETRVILKILTEIGEEERVGALALSHYAGRGAVRLLRHDDGAHLLEYAGDEDLTGMVKRGDDEQATAIIGDVLSALHATTTPPPDGLFTLTRWFRELFEMAERDRQNGVESIYRRGAAVTEAILADPREVRVLHGDMHHENVRYHPQRGWLAFDPKGLVGERTFDAANVLFNPIDMEAFVENEARLLRTAEILGQKLNLDPARILTFTFMFGCLSAAWIVNVNEDPRHDLTIAQLAEPHISV